MTQEQDEKSAWPEGPVGTTPHHNSWPHRATALRVSLCGALCHSYIECYIWTGYQRVEEV